MPRYDYICDACATRTEKTRKIAERDDPAFCDTCKGPLYRAEVNRGTDFLLTGGGWYRDGYSKPTGNGQ
jgi:putative FmdB family regulatory protein